MKLESCSKPVQGGDTGFTLLNCYSYLCKVTQRRSSPLYCQSVSYIRLYQPIQRKRLTTPCLRTNHGAVLRYSWLFSCLVLQFVRHIWGLLRISDINSTWSTARCAFFLPADHDLPIFSLRRQYIDPAVQQCPMAKPWLVTIAKKIRKLPYDFWAPFFQAHRLLNFVFSSMAISKSSMFFFPEMPANSLGHSGASLSVFLQMMFP